LTELAPALYHNASVKELDMSWNNLNDFVSTGLLRDILRCNKTITTLALNRNSFGEAAGAVERIAEGLGTRSNSTLLKIDLSNCSLGDGGLSSLAQAFGSRSTTLQKVALGGNSSTPTGVALLLETMERNSRRLMELDLQRKSTIGNEGAGLSARSLGSNVLPNLTRISLANCSISHDTSVALVLALEQNDSLLHLDLRNNGFSEWDFLALAGSLPNIKVLQRIDLTWCKDLASAMPLLLAGLRKNTSFFRFHVSNCAPSFRPTNNPWHERRRWRLDAENATFWVPKPLSPVDKCAERETSTSLFLAPCACPGGDTP
jgi:Ran GTPase-activating protein (RanGAP) involved in mRNA processing and transport